jgi:hypothetical protein
VNQLAVIRCVDCIGRDIDNEPLAFFKRVVGFDRAALVPEEQGDAPF